MIDLGAAKLFGILFESLGYGIFFMVFVYNTCLQIRDLSNKDAQRPNLLLLAFSALLFMMITTRWATEVARLYDVVVVLDGRISASDYFADLTLKKQIIVTSLAELQIVVADFILLYRLYHVWKPYWWLCIIPTLTWTGAWTLNILLIWSMSRPQATAGVFQSEVGRWVTPVLSCNIATNLYCTSAIIIRLWRSHHVTPHATPNSYIWRVLRIFVESASLFAVVLTASFIAFLAGSNIQYTFIDILSPVTGIAFLLILLRLNPNRHELSTVSRETVSKRGVPTGFPLQSINVNVSRIVDADSDLESKGAEKSSYGEVA